MSTPSTVNTPAPGSLNPPAFIITFYIGASATNGLTGLPPVALDIIKRLLVPDANISNVSPTVTITPIQNPTYQFLAKLAYPTAVLAPSVTQARCSLALSYGLTVQQATETINTSPFIYDPSQPANFTDAKAEVLNAALARPSCTAVATNFQATQKQAMIAKLTSLLAPGGALYIAMTTAINTYLSPVQLQTFVVTTPV